MIGAALKVGASVFGGIAASNAIKKMKRAINKQMKENENWYDRRYNEDATQKADAQAILTQTEDSIRERNQQAAGSAAVTGGTDESTAVAKQANNQALSQAVSNINAQAVADKSKIESQYLSKKADLQSQLNALQEKKAQNITNAVSGVADAAKGFDGLV